MRKHFVLILLSALLVVLSLLPAAYSQSCCFEWPTYRHDITHTGYTTIPAPSVARVEWQVETGGDTCSSAAVVDEKVYIGATCSEQRTVLCLDVHTGAVIWNQTVGGTICSSPAVVCGRVYIGTMYQEWDPVHPDPSQNPYGDKGVGGVYCLNAETGEIYWSYIIGHDGPPEHVGEYDVISSPAVVGERVYIGSGDSWTYPEGDSHVYCFNAFTGNLIWKYPTNDSVFSSPAVYCGKVYVGSYDENVYCLDASTGDLIWNKELNGTVWCSPTVDNGKVYVGNRERIIPRSDSIFYCLDANTGDLIWRYPAIDSGDEIGSIMSSPALAYGNVYIGTEEPDGSVYCLDADTGALKWTYETGGDIHHSSPAVAAGMVYIGSWATDIGVGEPGYLHCLNAHTGDRIWEYPDAPNGYHSSSPVIAYGMVFTAADNIIYAFDSTMFIIPEPTAMVTTILMFSALASVYFIKKTKLRSK